MKKTIHCIPLAIALVSGFSGIPDAKGELPSLEKQPWLGYYAAFANKRFNIGITPQLNIELSPMNSKGLPVGKKLAINIDAGIEETLPDGKAVMKQIKVDTLESGDPASDEFEKTSIRGKVTGDAQFELNLEQARGIIFIGGRVLDPGSLTKNPIRFVVRVRIPNGYPDSSDPQAKQLDKSSKAFLKKIKDDSLTVKWTDGKRVSQDFEKAVDAASKDLNGPGITSAEVEISSYHGNRLVFTAAPNSAMSLRNPKPAPLHEGFIIDWAADPAKDSEGKARLAIEVK